MLRSTAQWPFFFRRSTRVGPFRLNFSRSGIGASVGVKGARLTMTPRGTTYVTVGSHGFYYRETLSSRDAIRRVHPTVPIPAQPQAGSPEDTIASAGSLDLVDSSSERLVQQLNERANRSNRAWILYVAALMSLAGLAMLPDVPGSPKLPDPTPPFNTERNANTVDEYSALTARYGEPNSILFTEADPLAPIPVGTAQYSAGHVKVVFVPNGCANAYSQVMKILADRSQNAALAKREMKRVTQCLSSPDCGWTTVGYIDATKNSAISANIASVRLDAIPTRQTATPIVEFRSNPGNKRQPVSRNLTKKQLQKRPEMKSNDQSRLAADKMRRDIKLPQTRTLYSRTALLLAALGLFIAGVIAHKKNTEERKSRLFYELDEAEQQKHNVVQQALGLLSKCHRIWRIEAESGPRIGSATPELLLWCGGRPLVLATSALHGWKRMLQCLASIWGEASCTSSRIQSSIGTALATGRSRITISEWRKGLHGSSKATGFQLTRPSPITLGVTSIRTAALTDGSTTTDNYRFYTSASWFLRLQKG